MSLKKNKNDKFPKKNNSKEQLIKRKSDRKKRAKKENLTDKTRKNRIGGRREIKSIGWIRKH